MKERMPRVRFGKVHVFNNYYHYQAVSGDTGQNYAVAAGHLSKLLVESNYFDGTNNPLTWAPTTDASDTSAELVQRNNQFVNTTGDQVQRGSSFSPPYPYTADAAAQIKSSVMAGAGRK